MKGINSAIKEAKKIRDLFSPEARSIDLDAIAEHHNIKIKYEDFNDDLSGLLVKKNEQYIIGVNQNHPETRRRFTIAHELAHFFLHKENLHLDYFKADKNPVPLVYLRADGVISADETEANRFAAELLMPEELVIADFKKTKNIFELENLYNVSSSAMTYRLINLGLL